MSPLQCVARLSALTTFALLCCIAPARAADCPAWLDHDFQKLHSSETVNVCKLAAGKPLLIVNTASHCGFTPQFKGLEALHEKYRDQGLVVVGFPSNDFFQEAKDQAETAAVCYINYGVKFTMLAPSAVRGRDVNPVFRELAKQTEAPSWNFNKYLVAPGGKVLAHYDSTVTPESKTLNRAIESLLQAAAAKP
jgi:glutathione peroxidase